MNRKNTLVIAGLAIALLIGLAQSQPGTGTGGLGGYLADTVSMLLVAGGVALLIIALRWAIAQRSGGDQGNEPSAWEAYMQAVASLLVGGDNHYLDPATAYDAIANAIRRRELDYLALIEEAKRSAESPAAANLADVLGALKSYNGTAVRGLIAHLQEHEIEVPAAAKAKQRDGQSLLAWWLAIAPPPSPESDVHGVLSVHERVHREKNAMNGAMNGSGGGEG